MAESHTFGERNVERNRAGPINTINNGRIESSYFDLQVAETCFMLVTSRVCPALAAADAPGVLAALEDPVAPAPEVLPVIDTSCPTWSFSLAVSPVSVYVVPLSAVRV
jgi:hypothetical protein